MNKTIEALYYSLMEGVEGLYKPLITYGEHEGRIETAYKEIGLTLEQQNNLNGIFAGCSSIAERHGFEQGLKHGLKLGFAACNDEGK